MNDFSSPLQTSIYVASVSSSSALPLFSSFFESLVPLLLFQGTWCLLWGLSHQRHQFYYYNLYYFIVDIARSLHHASWHRVSSRSSHKLSLECMSKALSIFAVTHLFSRILLLKRPWMKTLSVDVENELDDEDMVEDELMSEKRYRDYTLFVKCRDANVFPKAMAAQAKKNTTAERQRKRQKRKKGRQSEGWCLPLASNLLQQIWLDCRRRKTIFLSPWSNGTFQAFRRYSGDIVLVFVGIITELVLSSRHPIQHIQLLWMRNRNRKGEVGRRTKAV